jgi:hypothetical protein
LRALYAFAFVSSCWPYAGQARTTRTSRLHQISDGVAVLRACSASAAPTWWRCGLPCAPCLCVPAGTALLAAIAIQWQVYPRRRSRLSRALSGLLEAAGRSAAAVRWRLMPARAARARS